MFDKTLLDNVALSSAASKSNFYHSTYEKENYGRGPIMQAARRLYNPKRGKTCERY